MSFKLKIIGGVMALAGLTLFGFGWPYRMLDWGSIQVMLGAVLAMGGVLLAALGFAVQEVHAHIGRLMEVAVRTAPEAATVVAAPPADKPVSPPVMPEVVPEAGIGAGGLAAATAAAGAAVIAGAAVATGRSAEAKDRLPETEPSFQPSAGLSKFDLDTFADEALARVAPVRDVAGSPIDELTAKINEAVGDIDLLRKGVAPKPEPEPEPVLDLDLDDRVDVPTAAEDVTTIRPDRYGQGPAGDEAEPELEPAPAEAVATAASEPEEPEAPERDEDVGDAEPAVEEAAPTAPVSSAEGIVGVHKVGASTFTMYADGTIRAETPDGAFGFASVAELKAYLAGDRSVARPL